MEIKPHHLQQLQLLMPNERQILIDRIYNQISEASIQELNQLQKRVLGINSTSQGYQGLLSIIHSRRSSLLFKEQSDYQLQKENFATLFYFFLVISYLAVVFYELTQGCKKKIEEVPVENNYKEINSMTIPQQIYKCAYIGIMMLLGYLYTFKWRYSANR